MSDSTGVLVLILALIAFGLFAGWIANFIVSTPKGGRSWGELLVAGLVGSFVGGLLASLINGDGIALKPSGMIGSIIGAVIVLVVLRAVRSRR